MLYTPVIQCQWEIHVTSMRFEQSYNIILMYVYNYNIGTTRNLHTLFSCQPT